MKRTLTTLLLFLLLSALTVFGLSACGKDKGGKSSATQLAAPTGLVYTGDSVVWNAVSGADRYVVGINDGGIETERTIGSTKLTYVPREADFTVTVRASSTSEQYSDSETVSKTFQRLDKVTGLAYDSEAILTWDAVPGATAYLLTVNGGSETIVRNTEFEPTLEASGSVQVRVRAIVEGDDSFYSLWADAPKITMLAQPTNIRYADGLLSWKSVDRANGYRVEINGSVLADPHNTTSIEFDSQQADFTAKITALGNLSSTFSASASQDFIYLQTVTDVAMDAGTLRWEPIDKATGYDIKVNNRIVERNRKEPNYPLSAGVSYSISIMPVTDDSVYFSNWSAARDYYILKAPTIRWNSALLLDGDANNNVLWDAVNEAEGYTAKITTPSGVTVERQFGEAARSFGESYLEVGVYTVAVKANAPTTNAEKFDSAYSNVITVERLASPSAAAYNFITSDPTSLASGFTVTYNTVIGASGYQLYKDGAKMDGLSSKTNQIHVGNLAEDSVIEEQTFNFSVKALGSVTNTKNISVKLDSLTESDMTFRIKVLAAPTHPYINGYNLEWDPIADASGYGVSVSGKDIFATTDTYYNLKGTEAGQWIVRVCARGNGSDCLASNYTAGIEVFRLYAPTNIRIGIDDASEGSLEWDNVNYATGYNVIIDQDDNPIPASTITNMNQWIRTTGTDVSMISVANYYNDTETVYYMTSEPSKTVRFIRLAPPTFPSPQFTNTQLLWNAPNNMNTQEYTPTYEVYLGNGAVLNGEKNGTSMNISTLAGGRSYTFRVKAIGDGTHYVNSEMSDAVEIYKLSAPSVRIENNQYVWDGVVSATGYAVYVDGVIQSNQIHQSGNSYSFSYNFDQLKTYHVEFYAIGDQGYSSINSDAAVIDQEVRQLATPEFGFGYSEPQYSVTGNIVMNITTPSPNARGYCYVVDGTSHNSEELTFSYNPHTAGSFVLRVYALGSVFDENNVYYVDSQSAGGSGRSTLTVLKSPNIDSVKYTMDGLISWANITGALGYEYYFAWDGENYGEMQTANQANFVVSALTSHSSFSIKVRAKGNGTNVISSEWVEKSFSLLL